MVRYYEYAFVDTIESTRKVKQRKFLSGVRPAAVVGHGAYAVRFHALAPTAAIK
eukprot:SAG11_NODE_880_length_6754_cov_29.319760_2_plen_54_part_00